MFQCKSEFKHFVHYSLSGKSSQNRESELINGDANLLWYKYQRKMLHLHVGKTLACAVRTNDFYIRTWQQQEPCWSSRGDWTTSERRQRKSELLRRCGKIWRKSGTSGFPDVRLNHVVTQQLRTLVDQNLCLTNIWDEPCRCCKLTISYLKTEEIYIFFSSRFFSSRYIASHDLYRLFFLVSGFWRR